MKVVTVIVAVVIGAVPYIVGLVLGGIVRFAAIAVASFEEGFAKGRGK